MDGWLDGWMDGWMDGWKDGCVKINSTQDSAPFVCHSAPFVLSGQLSVSLTQGPCRI